MHVTTKLVAIASLGTLLLLNVMPSGASRQSTRTEWVCVAARNLPAWTRMDANDMLIECREAGSVRPDAAHEISEVKGRYVVYPVGIGEVIPTTWLNASDHVGQLHIGIPRGRGTYSIRIPAEDELFGTVTAGDRLDVVLLVEPESDERRSLPRILVEQAEVDAVMPQDGQSGQIVSLLFTPEESERLLLAKRVGRLGLQRGE